MHLNNVEMIEPGMTVFLVHGFHNTGADIQAVKVIGVSTSQYMADSLFMKCSDVKLYGDVTHAHYDRSGWKWRYMAGEYMGTRTTSIRDMGIEPNSYNDHRAYTRLDEAMEYAELIAEGSVPTNKAKKPAVEWDIKDFETIDKAEQSIHRKAQRAQWYEDLLNELVGVQPLTATIEEDEPFVPNVYVVHNGGMNGMRTEHNPSPSKEDDTPAAVVEQSVTSDKWLRM